MSKTESFKAKVQAAMRIQIPRLVRWKYKLEAGMILEVEISIPLSPLTYERFYTSLRKDFRITVPRLYANALELEQGQVVTCQITIPKDILEKIQFQTLQTSTARGLFQF